MTIPVLRDDDRSQSLSMIFFFLVHPPLQEQQLVLLMFLDELWDPMHNRRHDNLFSVPISDKSQQARTGSVTRCFLAFGQSSRFIPIRRSKWMPKACSPQHNDPTNRISFFLEFLRWLSIII